MAIELIKANGGIMSDHLVQKIYIDPDKPDHLIICADDKKYVIWNPCYLIAVPSPPAEPTLPQNPAAGGVPDTWEEWKEGLLDLIVNYRILGHNEGVFNANGVSGRGLEEMKEQERVYKEIKSLLNNPPKGNDGDTGPQTAACAAEDGKYIADTQQRKAELFAELRRGVVAECGEDDMNEWLDELEALTS